MTEFTAPRHWLPRFKSLSNCGSDSAFLRCYRTSKWQIEVNLMLSDFTIVGSWKVNVRTNNFERTI